MEVGWSSPEADFGSFCVLPDGRGPLDSSCSAERTRTNATLLALMFPSGDGAE